MSTGAGQGVTTARHPHQLAGLVRADGIVPPLRFEVGTGKGHSLAAVAVPGHNDEGALAGAGSEGDPPVRLHSKSRGPQKHGASVLAAGDGETGAVALGPKEADVSLVPQTRLEEVRKVVHLLKKHNVGLVQQDFGQEAASPVDGCVSSLRTKRERSRTGMTKTGAPDARR